MIRSQELDNIPRWFSEEKDWEDADGNTICCWKGCIIEESEYEDFRKFLKDEGKTEAEPIGSFTTENGMIVFVFIVKTNVTHFAVWRLRFNGEIMWWYDFFWEMNGGKRVSDQEIMPIIEKLGLTVKKESCLTDYVLQ
jgi:hypothetical protein